MHSMAGMAYCTNIHTFVYMYVYIWLAYNRPNPRLAAIAALNFHTNVQRRRFAVEASLSLFIVCFLQKSSTNCHLWLTLCLFCFTAHARFESSLFAIFIFTQQ